MKNYIPILIIISTFCIQLTSGINYIIIPLTLEDQLFSNTLIGLAMSFEVLATILLFKHISKAVKKVGVIPTILGASLIRGIIIYLFGFNTTFIFWLGGIFIYGIATSMILVVIQTWLNLTAKGKSKGIFIGLYSSALSLGVALGPQLLRLVPDDRSFHFLINACIPVIPVLVLVPIFKYRPTLPLNVSIRVFFIFKNAKIVMLSALLGGICFFGLQSFLAIYGVSNGLSEHNAALLLTTFMVGSVGIGLLISTLSAIINREIIILVCVFISVICAVFLAIAVYANLLIALILLLIWGGCMGGIYATGLAYIGDVFRKEDQISANTSFILMDSIGGFAGVFIIGTCMDMIGEEGLTYIIVCASITYLVFIVRKLAARFKSS